MHLLRHHFIIGWVSSIRSIWLAGLSLSRRACRVCLFLLLLKDGGGILRARRLHLLLLCRLHLLFLLLVLVGGLHLLLLVFDLRLRLRVRLLLLLLRRLAPLLVSLEHGQTHKVTCV